MARVLRSAVVPGSFATFLLCFFFLLEKFPGPLLKPGDKWGLRLRPPWPVALAQGLAKGPYLSIKGVPPEIDQGWMVIKLWTGTMSKQNLVPMGNLAI